MEPQLAYHFLFLNLDQALLQQEDPVDQADSEDQEHQEHHQRQKHQQFLD